jgi:probable HAF family extracellular repeat protein
LLPDVYDDWAVEERERLTQLYLETLRQAVRTLENSGERERAIEYARLTVRTDPHREEARADLMRLYLAQGDPVSALKQYQQFEAVLKRELDLLPSQSLQALARSCREAARAQKADVQASAPASSSPPVMSPPIVAEASPVDNVAPIPTPPAKPNRWGKGYRLGLALGMVLLCTAIVLILRPRNHAPVQAHPPTLSGQRIKKQIAIVRNTPSSPTPTVSQNQTRSMLTIVSHPPHPGRSAQTPATSSRSASSLRQPGSPELAPTPDPSPKNRGGENAVFMREAAPKIQESPYTITDIGTLHGDTESYALALNAAGQVVGYSQSGSLPHAFLYDASGIRPLAPNASHSGVGSIANDGQVAGGNEDEAVVWDTAGSSVPGRALGAAMCAVSTIPSKSLAQ